MLSLENGKLRMVFFKGNKTSKILIKTNKTSKENNSLIKTTVHPWCSDHSTSISACEVWGARVGVHVFRRKFHTYIYLD